MHGAVHDYIVLKTVVSAGGYQSGETHDNLTIADAQKGKPIGLLTPPSEQPQFDRLLEIGSLDIIGSMRDYNFMGRGVEWKSIVGVKEYVGIDLMAGKSVDHVMDAHDLKFDDESFDIVLCLQMLEHDSDAPQTIKEAYRVLKYGQPFIMTCASEEHPEHADLGGGSDAYIFIKESDLEKWFRDAGFDLGEVEVTKDGSNFYVYAVKTKSKNKGHEYKEVIVDEATDLKKVKAKKGKKK